MKKTEKVQAKKGKPSAKKAKVAFPTLNHSYHDLSTKDKKKFLNYQKEYVKNHYRTYLIRMNTEDDAEIISWLGEHDNMSECIRQCVESAMKRDRKRSK